MACYDITLVLSLRIIYQREYILQELHV